MSHRTSAEFSYSNTAPLVPGLTCPNLPASIVSHHKESKDLVQQLSLSLYELQMHLHIESTGQTWDHETYQNQMFSHGQTGQEMVIFHFSLPLPSEDTMNHLLQIQIKRALKKGMFQHHIALLAHLTTQQQCFL